jgi:hypothetical protein
MWLSCLLGAVGSFVYGSFLEWFIHKHTMHTPRFSKLAFDRHAIAHHTERRSLKTFYIPPEDHAKYEFGESSVIPILWLAHFPLYYSVWHFVNPAAGIGTAMGGLLYMLGYEFIHFFIHAPRNYWFQRTRVFRFYCEYHRIHHHKARWNYNIVMPLADFVLRTFSLEPIEPEPSAPEFMPADTGPKTVFQARQEAAGRR